MTVMILIMCSICLIVGVRATGGTSFPEPIQELHHTLSNPKQRQSEQQTSFEPRSSGQGERSSFGGVHQTSPSFPSTKPGPTQGLHQTMSSNPKEQQTSFKPRSFEQGERSSFGGFHQTSPSFPSTKPEPIQGLHQAMSSDPKVRQSKYGLSFDSQSSEKAENPFGGQHQTSPSFSGRKEEPIPKFDYNLPFPNLHQSEHKTSSNPKITSRKFEIFQSNKPGNPIVKRRVHSQTSDEGEGKWSFDFFPNFPTVDSNEDENSSDLGKKIDGFKRDIKTISDKVPGTRDLISSLNKFEDDISQGLLTSEERKRLHALRNPPKTSKTTKFLKYVLLPLSLLAGGFLIWYYIKNRQP